jgi:hypothetical protein
VRDHGEARNAAHADNQALEKVDHCLDGAVVVWVVGRVAALKADAVMLPELVRVGAVDCRLAVSRQRTHRAEGVHPVLHTVCELGVRGHGDDANDTVRPIDHDESVVDHARA